MCETGKISPCVDAVVKARRDLRRVRRIDGATRALAPVDLLGERAQLTSDDGAALIHVFGHKLAAAASAPPSTDMPTDEDD